MRTFCVITTAANELVAQIHDRMPVIFPPESYDHWLSKLDPDPRGLLVPFPSEAMKIWPISTTFSWKAATVFLTHYRILAWHS